VSEVVAFKVRREIKRKMEELKGEVNWPEELRKFVEMRIREVEARRSRERVRARLRSAGWSVPRGTSASLVRGNRDSH